jgi:hypothetical protein
VANNKQNLVSIGDRTTEEQREICSKGGKASAAARRKKRDAKSAARLILSLPTVDKVTKSLEKLGIDDETEYTNMVSIFAMAYLKAMKGDIGAMRFIVEMAGMSPEFKMVEERHKNEMRLLREKAGDGPKKENNLLDAIVGSTKEDINTDDIPEIQQETEPDTDMVE